MIDPVKGKLIKLKAIQLNNRLVCGNAYEDTEGYICVNEVGRLYTPNWLTTSFGKLLKKHESYDTFGFMISGIVVLVFF